MLRQRASDQPILDLALLRRPAFTAALIAIFAGMFTAYGFMAYTSIWLQSLTGLSPLQAGLVILPSAVASMAVSVMAGHWLRRFLPRYSLPVALLLVAAGALAQTGLTPASTGSRVIAGLLISGFGMGMVFPAASSLAVESVPHRLAGMAAGAFTTFQQLGYAIGVAIFATVVAAMAKTGLTGHATDPRATAQQLTGGGAHAITTQAPAAARSALEHLLRTAFVHGLNAAALIGAILALAAAVITALALRREATATPSHAEPDYRRHEPPAPEEFPMSVHVSAKLADEASRLPAAAWLVLGIVLVAEVMDLLDSTITTIAAPTISSSLHGGPGLIKWLGASYALALEVLLVTGGRLGDKYGRRRIFLIGLAGFTVASLACGLAWDPPSIIVARLVQGAFGALLIPQGFGNWARSSRASTSARRSAPSARSWGCRLSAARCWPPC